MTLHLNSTPYYYCTEPNRAADWDSIVTIHDNSSDDSLAVTPAHTWHLHHHKIGNHKLSSKFVTSGARPQVCTDCCIMLVFPIRSSMHLMCVPCCCHCIKIMCFILHSFIENNSVLVTVYSLLLTCSVLVSLLVAILPLLA